MDPTTDGEFKYFSKVVKHLKETKKNGLKYEKLYFETAKIVVLTDASFSNARGMRSQLGFLVLMIVEAGAANIIH